MLGDDLYPLFDEYGDMIAMSVGYQRKKGRKNVKFFDAYTANKHIKWSSESGSWQEIENEDITLLKIPQFTPAVLSRFGNSRQIPFTKLNGL